MLHPDGKLDGERVRRFVAAYQTVRTLNLGELWSIPIMLRLALVENLRRISSRFACDRTDRNLATEWGSTWWAMACRSWRRHLR